MGVDFKSEGTAAVKETATLATYTILDKIISRFIRIRFRGL